MKIQPTPDDWSLASSVYAEFRAKPESQFIASRYALAHLAALASQIKPRSVLEIGAGIGTITKLLLSHPAEIGSVVSTEAHEICRAELSGNIPQSDRWALCYDVKDAAEAGPFDLVVLDGTIEPNTAALFSNEAVFFIEGNRRPERRVIEQFFVQAGKSVVFEQYSPSWQLRRKSRLILGLFPKLKLQRQKGCFVGRVSSLKWTP